MLGCGLESARGLRMLSVATTNAIVCWKLEDVPVGDGEAPHPDDIGPASIYRPVGGEEAILVGEWIKRADAQRIAAENTYDLQLDDGFE